MDSLRLWIVVGTGLFVTLFWDAGILLPVKLLVVLVHECWHGIVAMFSGAVLDQIHVNFQESGETVVSQLYSTPGFVLSVSAGYAGTALTGALLLSRGLAGRLERTALFVFAGTLGYMSYLFTEIGSLAFFTGLGWAAGLAALGSFGRQGARFALLIFGTLFLFYCFYDLYDFPRDLHATDAGILAQYIRAKDWTYFGDWNATDLAVAISIVWSLLMFVILGLVLAPVFQEMIAPTPLPPAPAPAEPPAGTFPGEMTPDVQEWLLFNGFGLDGRPLPPELLDESSFAAMQSPGSSPPPPGNDP